MTTAKLDETRLDQIFRALANPTRRMILKDISSRSRAVQELAERHPMSLNGVSKHLKVLEAAGLVSRRVRGNSHIISLQAQTLKTAVDWLRTYEEFWERSLRNMKRVVENDRAPD